MNNSFSNDIHNNDSALMKAQSPCDMIIHKDDTNVRPGCKDIWNAFMVDGANFGAYDIPFCPTTATHIPAAMVTWEEAKQIHKKHIARKEYDYHEDAFVNWYIDDYKFDGVRGVWHDYNFALKVLRHFAGAITIDYSTNQDFPQAIKIYATYRMRAFGYWLGQQGIEVINNVRWGTNETFDYCFEGIPKDSIIAIGTVGGGPRKLADRERFETGLYKMVEELSPHTILIYGSANGECFNKLKESGISIVSYQSSTAKVYERRKPHE